MTPTRRGLLTGLTSSLILSPAVIRVADLMPIKPFWLRSMDDLPWKPHPLALLQRLLAEDHDAVPADWDGKAMQARVELGNGKMLSVLRGGAPLLHSNGRDTFEVGIYSLGSNKINVRGHVTGPEVIRMIERGGAALV